MPYRINVLLCTGTHCVSYRSFEIMEAMQRELKKHKLESEVAIIPAGCSGFCPHGPIAQIQPEGIFYQKFLLEDIPYLVEEHFLKGRPVKKFMFTPPETKEPIPIMSDIPFFSKQVLIALRNRGLIDPEKIEEYIAQDGYKGFTKAITIMTPYEIINEIKESGLRGRGGGGFPTGLKWEVAYNEPTDEKYLIVNCDEGDPGAFMDRSIVESDPHSIIEGMLIGAYALGVKQGYIYVRMEYPLALKRFYIAIEQAREYGLLGKNILDKGIDFDIEVHQGAGAFICGEETALIRSIQGLVGEAQPKYVYPAQKGLNGKPTIINNVETWANVPQIILRGAKWFASIGNRSVNGGEKGCTGTKVFSLVGKVNNTGLIEVPMGTTLREIIFDIGGGIQNNKQFKAVQTGGPSGGFLPRNLLDLAVDYEELTAAGSMMGSGGMVVLDEDNCMVDMAKYFLDFVQSESCGKCIPCREGTKRMLDILDKISKGEGTEADLVHLEELAHMITESSLCALGGTAPNPVLTTLKYFREEYETHVKDKKCPAHACRELNTYYIDEKKCLEEGHGCGVCKKNCPDNAIAGELKGVHRIDPLICGKCGVCYDLCNFKAIYVE